MESSELVDALEPVTVERKHKCVFRFTPDMTEEQKQETLNLRRQRRLEVSRAWHKEYVKKGEPRPRGNKQQSQGDDGCGQSKGVDNLVGMKWAFVRKYMAENGELGRTSSSELRAAAFAAWMKSEERAAIMATRGVTLAGL